MIKVKGHLRSMNLVFYYQMNGVFCEKFFILVVFKVSTAAILNRVMQARLPEALHLYRSSYLL